MFNTPVCVYALVFCISMAGDETMKFNLVLLRHTTKI